MISALGDFDLWHKKKVSAPKDVGSPKLSGPNLNYAQTQSPLFYPELMKPKRLAALTHYSIG